MGGTSLSTPLWAGVINAASTASGHFAASTQAELTKMYSDYANHSVYAADFWDITYGACNYYSGSFSGGGYDLCTGLGSPKGPGREVSPFKRCRGSGRIPGRFFSPFGIDCACPPIADLHP